MKVKFYSLSTCIWCRKTRQYLDENKIPYDEVVVDKLAGSDREDVLKEMEKANPRKSFPTLVFDNNQVVVGYKPDDIRAALNQ